MESLLCGVRYGADAVECDISFLTADGQYILFHDPDLMRLAGIPCTVSEMTYAEIAAVLVEKTGYHPITLDDLCERYHESTPVLLDIGLPAEAAFVERIRHLPFPFICGVSRPEDVRVFRTALPDQKLLGFVPSPEHVEAFLRDGVDIIRLWEHWLDRITPADVKAMKPGVEVWIMSFCDGNMDGNAASVARLEQLGADGVLLNDITLAKRI